jgi:hypothetical protein
MKNAVLIYFFRVSAKARSQDRSEGIDLEFRAIGYAQYLVLQCQVQC